MLLKQSNITKVEDVVWRMCLNPWSGFDIWGSRLAAAHCKCSESVILGFGVEDSTGSRRGCIECSVQDDHRGKEVVCVEGVWSLLECVKW